MAAQEGENAPVIITAFASTELRQGETWKVFLQAQDPDGDMNRIVCTLEQPGVGVQPASFIKIREDRRRNLSGYIFLNTGSVSGFQFTSCRLTVQIQDKKGNPSNSVSFPLTLNPRAVQQSPPPGVFQDEDLGPVQIPFPSMPGP
ncbi:MAG: hypothetical protein NTV04_10630 [Deltaproteobacteria bacterium]|jgi:hypothetical protein|nr:hypothetical protein [Deltaproteobacteria bacterium]